MNVITSLQHCSNRILSTNSLMILPSRRGGYTLFIFIIFYVGTHCLMIPTRKTYA